MGLSMLQSHGGCASDAKDGIFTGCVEVGALVYIGACQAGRL
jgi:hypothetical protein